MAVKISELEIENVKRVKAVKIEPTENGLTVIGGKNGQGKTSVLDAIAWALGGNKFRPSQPERDGSVTPPHLNITLSNGLVVERKGKNADLKVIDPNGQKAGQQLLDSFVEELALDLPKFMNASSKEKANTLLQILGVGDQLVHLEQKEKEIYNERLTIGRIADQKKKFAAEQEFYTGVPLEPIAPSDLIQQQQTIMAKNAENQRKRQALNSIQQKADSETAEIERVQAKLDEMKKFHETTLADLEVAKQSAQNLQDESTAELEKNLAEIESINVKVRANLDKEKAEEDARDYEVQYGNKTTELEQVREQKSDLLNGAELPLPGLSVKDGELIYNDQQWDNMSGAEQLRVATAIVRKLKPDCGFILLDKLEQMDVDTLTEFGQWLEQEGLQAIATRVSSGEECEIIIEDGYVKQSLPEVVGETIAEQPKWKEGQF